MCDAPQASFNATNNNGYVFVSLPHSLTVNSHRAVGPTTGFVTRCISVVIPALTISGVMINHRVHVTRGHAEIKIGLAQGFERVGAVPVGLRNDTHSIPLSF